MSVLVFVYGTLKRGFYNGKLLEGEATAALVGSFVTQDKFPLITDEYYVPYLLPTKGTGFNIIGEVWKVNQTTFDKLDKLEGFPDYYNRKQIQVSPTAVQDGAAGAAVEGGGGEVQEMKPWVYTMPAGRVTADLLAKTMMPEYSLEEHLAKRNSKRAHFAAYEWDYGDCERLVAAFNCATHAQTQKMRKWDMQF